MDNKVLRAFGKIMSENCRVTNGKEAVALLLGSVKVKQVRKGVCVWVWVWVCVGVGVCGCGCGYVGVWVCMCVQR